MQGLFDAKSIEDGTVTERKLSLDIQDKLNNRVPDVITTEMVSDNYDRDGFPVPPEPNAKNILDVIAGRLKTIKELITGCNCSGYPPTPTLTASALIEAFDQHYVTGNLLTISGATGTNLTEPISIMVTGDLADYVVPNVTGDYTGGPYQLRWLQDWNTPGVITGQIIYVSGGLYAITEVRFQNSEPSLTIVAEDYYRFYEVGQTFEIEVEGQYLYENIQFILDESLIDGRVIVTPGPDWNSRDGGTLVVTLSAEHTTRFVGKLTISSSGIAYSVEFGCAGPLPVDPTDEFSTNEENFGNGQLLYDFGNVIVGDSATQNLGFTLKPEYSGAAQISYPIPEDLPVWESVDNSSTAETVDYDLTYAPVSGGVNNIDAIATVRFDDDPNNRYSWVITVTHLGSGGEPSLRVDPTESLNNDFVVDDVIIVNVYGANLLNDITYELDNDLEDYFTIEQVSWNPRTGGVLRLRVTSAVPISGIDGYLIVTSGDLSATTHITGVGDLDDNPKLIVDSLLYYAPQSTDDTWEIGVIGQFLTEDISIAVSANLQDYIEVVEQSGWDARDGGTLDLNVTALPAERTIGVVTISSSGQTHSFEVGFPGTNPLVTFDIDSPYDFGDVQVGDTKNEVITATLTQAAEDDGGLLYWTEYASGNENADDIGVIFETNTGRSEVKAVASYTPPAVQPVTRNTLVTVRIGQNDRYPWTFIYVFTGQGIDSQTLTISPETVSSPSYADTPINFVVTGINLTEDIVVTLAGDIATYFTYVTNPWNNRTGGTLTLNPTASFTGTITGTVTVTSGSMTAVATITLTAEQRLTVSPMLIDRDVNVGDSFSADVVGENLQNDISWVVSDSIRPYITLTADDFDLRLGGTIVLTVTQNFDGQIEGTITVTSGSLSRVVTIILRSLTPETLTATPSTVVFATDGTPLYRDVTVVGANLKGDIEIVFNSTYFTATPQANWNVRTGGTVRVAYTSIPENRVVDDLIFTTGTKSAIVQVGSPGTDIVVISPTPEGGGFDFGRVPINTSKTQQILINLTPDAISAGLKILSVTNAGGGVGESYFVLNTNSSSDTAINYNGVYTPLALGAHQRTLIVRIGTDISDPFATEVTYVLRGTGVQPALSVTPKPLANGIVLSSGQTLTATVTGTDLQADIVVGLTGEVAEYFTISYGSWNARTGGQVILTLNQDLVARSYTGVLNVTSGALSDSTNINITGTQSAIYITPSTVTQSGVTQGTNFDFTVEGYGINSAGITPVLTGTLADYATVTQLSWNAVTGGTLRVTINSTMPNTGVQGVLTVSATGTDSRDISASSTLNLAGTGIPSIRISLTSNGVHAPSIDLSAATGTATSFSRTVYVIGQYLSQDIDLSTIDVRVPGSTATATNITATKSGTWNNRTGGAIVLQWSQLINNQDRAGTYIANLTATSGTVSNSSEAWYLHYYHLANSPGNWTYAFGQQVVGSQTLQESNYTISTVNYSATVGSGSRIVITPPASDTPSTDFTWVSYYYSSDNLSQTLTMRAYFEPSAVSSRTMTKVVGFSERGYESYAINRTYTWTGSGVAGLYWDREYYRVNSPAAGITYPVQLIAGGLTADITFELVQVLYVTSAPYTAGYAPASSFNYRTGGQVNLQLSSTTGSARGLQTWDLIARSGNLSATIRFGFAGFIFMSPAQPAWSVAVGGNISQPLGSWNPSINVSGGNAQGYDASGFSIVSSAPVGSPPSGTWTIAGGSALGIVPTWTGKATSGSLNINIANGNLVGNGITPGTYQYRVTPRYTPPEDPRFYVEPTSVGTVSSVNSIQQYTLTVQNPSIVVTPLSGSEEFVWYGTGDYKDYRVVGTGLTTAMSLYNVAGEYSVTTLSGWNSLTGGTVRVTTTVNTNLMTQGPTTGSMILATSGTVSANSIPIRRHASFILYTAGSFGSTSWTGGIVNDPRDTTPINQSRPFTRTGLNSPASNSGSISIAVEAPWATAGYYISPTEIQGQLSSLFAAGSVTYTAWNPSPASGYTFSITGGTFTSGRTVTIPITVFGPNSAWPNVTGTIMLTWA